MTVVVVVMVVPVVPPGGGRRGGAAGRGGGDHLRRLEKQYFDSLTHLNMHSIQFILFRNIGASERKVLALLEKREWK